jgi:hypothetical protein
MARIAIIVGHARHNTFCEALGRTYRCGAMAGGHEAALFVTIQGNRCWRGGLAGERPHQPCQPLRYKTTRHRVVAEASSRMAPPKASTWFVNSGTAG